MKKTTVLLAFTMVFGCSQKSDWETLFDGQNLDSWHLYGGGEGYNGWSIENGILVFNPSDRKETKSADLVTNEQYTSFELSLEWMISDKGNSGIMWGVIDEKKYEHPYETGPEIQIIDENWEEYITERGVIQRSGSIFNVLAPEKLVVKPAGEWNSYLIHIDQKNNEGFVEANGARILNFPLNNEAWSELVKNSPFPKWAHDFGLAQTGYICLQEHGSQVAFRNIKIRSLN